MAKLLPFRQSEPPEPREPRLVELEDEAADDVFAALSAGTARDILGRLYEEPATATDVAEAADTSLQNARYHLEKLKSAGLVEAVDTWYSSRGTEMTVYAPTSEPLVVAAGPEEQTGVLRSALGRLVGALGVLGIASLLVDRLARRGVGVFPVAQTGGAAGGNGGDAVSLAGEATTRAAEYGAANATTPAPTPTEASTVAREATGTPVATQTPTVPAAGTAAPTPSPTVAPTGTSGPTATPQVVERTVIVQRTVVREAAGGPLDLGGLPPGGLFFAGGLVVLAAVAGWWYWRRYRPLYG
ncbi:MAG: helix-turn-helix domain-containing protein [Halobacteriales archaeon]